MLSIPDLVSGQRSNAMPWHNRDSVMVLVVATGLPNKAGRSESCSV
jgi:hypothetical protein